MTRTHRQRDGGEPKHARFYERETACPAYRSLNVYARALLMEMKRKYNGLNNGGISMSFREACVLVGCSNKPMKLAYLQLVDRGFMKLVKAGTFGDRIFVGGPLRASTWTLTEYAIDEPVRIPGVPTRDYMRWQMPGDLEAHDQALLEKNRCARSVRKVRSGHTASNDTVRRERTSSGPTAYVKQLIEPEDSTLRAHTYSLPSEGAQPLGSVLTNIIAKTAARKQPAPQGEAAVRAG